MSKLILFDAVGTIIYPKPDVVTAYYAAGVEFGSQQTRESVAARFKLARQKWFHVGADAKATPAKSLPSNDELEKELWRSLVTDVFNGVEESDLLFDALWTHFADSNHWATFDDVASCWDRLKQMGFQIGIASNFDSRLNLIVKDHLALSDVDFVFCSAEIGFRKPDPEFYRRVKEQLPVGISATDIVMVGDDVQNDWAAPSLHGWKAYSIDRSANPLTVRSSATDQRLSSLNELLDRLA